ncbi:MAG: hypothetical protein A2Y62_04720 [Candidatus Fischerbacteria bacterium RBG_13_37_8]|uniref:Helix-turn-helix domain-containing protein n=1 Tax=Candidatus Fischerbacteria bacterium RBG_13_37_8 TaxID=1817863 RepID=A0A1F5VVH0_9BACT|nr:MAG: hypothetical protein A2Y62_04720 [Candidatus Fischerbacteria bacterium RBG_13_37_8]
MNYSAMRQGESSAYPFKKFNNFMIIPNALLKKSFSLSEQAIAKMKIHNAKIKDRRLKGDKSGREIKIKYGQQKLNYFNILVYGRLVQYAGRDGQCYPSQNTLAKEFGTSRSRIAQSIENLINYSLIGKMTTTSNGYHNKYYFIWHKAFYTNMQYSTCQQDKVDPPVGQGLSQITNKHDPPAGHKKKKKKENYLNKYDVMEQI